MRLLPKRAASASIALATAVGAGRFDAVLDKATPDGICLDAEGAVWLASPISREVIRVREGGEVTHRIATPGQAVACMLGGPDRGTLFVLTGKVMATPGQSREALSGTIYTLPVDVPGAGLP